MKEHGEINRRDPRDVKDVISLSDLLAPLWYSRKLIAASTLLAVIVGGTGAWFQAKYRSEGFMQFGGTIPLSREVLLKDKNSSPGILLADYKRYAAAFSTSGRFDDFLQQNKLTEVAGVEGLRKVFASRNSISKLVEPVYPFTKLDAKELMEQPKDSSNNVIGLRINYEAASPESAQRMVGLLGRYAIDSIVYLIYSDALRFKHAEITARITSLDNAIIERKEALEGYRRRGAALKQIVVRYPESTGQAGRQVVSVTEDNARFLSPVTHLMSTEVEASMATEAIIRARREQRQSLLLREYYDQAKLALDNNKSGEAILRALEPVKESVFKGKDLNDEMVQEVYNTISMDNQNAISLYLEKIRFIAGPSLSENRTTRMSTALLMSFMVGLLLSSLLVFGRNWWRDHRLKMVR